MKRYWNVVAVAALGPCLAAFPAQASVQVDQALVLMRATCSIPNTALEIKPTPEGRLELLIAFSNGQRRALALARTDLDSFSEAATKAMATQPTELTGCMNPYIDDVVAGLTRLPAKPGALPPPPAALPAAPPVAGLASPPPLPRTGELPVGLINNPGSAAVAAAPPAPATGELVMRVTGCRASGRQVLCDVKVTNNTGRDVKLVVQGAYSKLYGEDGSQIQAGWATLGNQHGELRYGSHQAVLNLIAATAPVVNLTFQNVPSELTAIKRLELSMGVQTAGGVELQKMTVADLPIQGR